MSHIANVLLCWHCVRVNRLLSALHAWLPRLSVNQLDLAQRAIISHGSTTLAI